MRTNNLPVAVLTGVIAFVVTYVAMLILAAIFDALNMASVADVLQRFAWLVSVVVGIVYGWNRYHS